MTFPFKLSRVILLSFIVIMNMITTILSAIAFYERTGGGFQVLAICFGIVSVLTIIGCLCHQYAYREEETSNSQNLSLFGFCGLLNLALAVSLTVHARQDHGVGLCNDFANVTVPCIPAGIQLGMTYVTPVFALMGFIISWIDKYPGAVKVAPRYPVTKAPSSHFAAHMHELDSSYTRTPVRTTSKPRNNSEWSDVPIC